MSDSSFCPLTRAHQLEDNRVKQSHIAATVVLPPPLRECSNSEHTHTKKKKKNNSIMELSIPIRRNDFLRAFAMLELASDAAEQPPSCNIHVGNQPHKRGRSLPLSLPAPLILLHSKMRAQNAVIMAGLCSVWAIVEGAIGCRSALCLCSRGNCDSGMH